MPYWTIQYYPDPDLSDFTEKIWDDASGTGWGLVDGKLSRRSFDTDELSFTADGQLIDSPPLFEYGSKLIVYRDRILNTDGTFSGGTIYFQGVITKQRRIGSPTSEVVKYTVSGPWWYLTQDCYEQFIAIIGAKTSHVVLNMQTTVAFFGTNLTITQQVGNILDDALSKFGAIFTYIVGNEFAATFPPIDEKRDLPYAEALKEEFKWAPRTITWFDYSQNPPVLNIGNISSLASTTLSLGSGVLVVSEDIVPRYDLQIDQCVFRYEETDTINGQDTFNWTTDTYPPTTSSKTGIMRATVNLQGLRGTEQIAILTTRDLTLNAVTNPLAGNNSWWIDKHPQLSNLTYQGITAGPKIHDIVLSVSGSGNIGQFEILEGCFHSWMRVGNTNSGALGFQTDVNVQALIDYTDQFGNIVINEPINVKVKTTNLPSNTYSRLRISSYADFIPVGLAQFFYNCLSVLPWEGEVVVEGGGGADGSEVTAQQFLGRRLNLTGGLIDWTTMLAPIHAVEEDLDDGRVTVKFGPNKWLSPEQIVDLLKVTQRREYTFYSQSVIFGLTQNQTVSTPDNTVKENSSKGLGNFNKHIISFTDPSSPTKTSVTLDAINKILTMSTTNTDDGVIQLSLGDLNA